MRVVPYALFVVSLFATVTLSACRTALPQYSWEGQDAALATMLSYDRIQTFSAACRMTMISETKKKIRLDGAVAASLPGHFRIQTWKFGRNAFDLIVTPEANWVAASSQLKEHKSEESLDFESLWSWLNLNQMLDHSYDIVRSNLRSVTLGPKQLGSAPLGFEPGDYLVIDKRTRTCRRFYRIDQNGNIIMSVSLSDWTLIDDRPWPLRLIATSNLGQVDLRFEDVMLNQRLPETAFQPPRQAIQIK